MSASLSLFLKKKNLNKSRKKKSMLHSKEDSIDQACNVKANLTSEREV
jgi:hypothetical protein